MKLKKAYFRRADEFDFGIERIRPFNFWFEFVIDDKVVTRENYYDVCDYYSPHWRGVNFIVQPIYIGQVNHFPQEVITEHVSNMFLKIEDCKNPVAVVNDSVYVATGIDKVYWQKIG